MRLVAATCVALFAVAACSGGSSGDSKGNRTGATEDTAANAAQARDEVARALRNPEGILLNEPLSRRPAPGKRIVVVQQPQPVVKVVHAGMAEAAALLGWQLEIIKIDPTLVDGAPKAFDQALDRRPDAVFFSGTPLALLGKQLTRAKQMNIPVLAESIADPPRDGVISTSLDGTQQVAEYGRLIGQYVATESGGKAHVAVFTISAYPVLTVFTNSFKQALTAACPTCKILVVNQQTTDLINMRTPKTVVETLQRDPNINWAIFSFGDLTQGVAEALRQAGLQGKVKIGGETASSDNIARLRQGTEEVWTGLAATILGWRDIDMLARYFNNDSLETANRTLIPTQLLTRGNVDAAHLDPATGYYVGYSKYTEAFKRLWGLG